MTASLDEQNRPMTGSAKSRASIASVGISEVTAVQLRHLRDAQRLTERTRPDGWRHDLVIPNRIGRPMS